MAKKRPRRFRAFNPTRLLPLLGVCMLSAVQAQTTVTVTASPNPATLGQNVTLIATLTQPTGPVTSGVVTFTFGDFQVGAADVNASGQAVLTTDQLPSGTAPLTASFLGTVYYGPFASSPAVSLTVNALPASSFAAATNYSAGQGPGSIAVGDFNNDGIPDLAIASQTINQLTILLGQPNGGFTQAPGSPYTIGTNTQPVHASVAVGFFDLFNAGNADLLVSNWADNSVTVLLGNGDGTFTQASGSPIFTQGPWSIAVADFGGNGVEDFAVANFVGPPGGGLTFVYGNGDGTFSPGSLISENPPTSLVTGDFNGDGIPDVAWASADGVSVLLNYGLDGGFIVQTISVSAYQLAIGDFNHDGFDDIAVLQGANASPNQLLILLGAAAVPFTSVNFTQPPGSPFFTGTGNYISAAVGDFNGDGKPDVGIVSGSGQVEMMLGDGTGAFALSNSSPFTAGTSPLDIVAADFNRDGKTDVAIANQSSNNVSILLGVGPPASIAATSGTPQSVIVGTTFSIELQATVRDASGNPVPNTAVTFTAPASGASGIFAVGRTSDIVQTDAAGQATAPTFTANATAGAYTVTATVSGVPTAASFALTNIPLVAITTTSLPGGTVGVSYSANLSALGGVTPYSWSIVSGSLPAGLHLTSGTGAISGTPTAAGTASFTVQLTDSGSPVQTVTKQLTITIAPAPSITSLSPSSAVARSPAFTLTVNGSGFTNGAAVQWNGAALPTTFVSSTELTATVAATLIATPGTAAVTVVASGATSNHATFTIQVAVTLTSVSPSSAIAGGSAFTLTVNGSGFAAGAVVEWNGTALPTTFVSATQLTASVPATLIVGAGTAAVTVISGGVTSNGLQFSVAAAVTITSLSPSSAIAGGSAFTLTVSGSGFANGAAVQWNGTALSTNFVSATQLSATVPATLIASAEAATVTVVSTGVTSNRAAFTINLSISIILSSSSSQPGQTVSGTQVQSAQPAPAATSGTISLSFDNTNGLPGLPSNYINPGVCFGSSANCGNPPQLTYTFTIPAGSSSAQIPDVQTGTVAGDIVLTVSGQPNNPSKITVPLTLPVIEPNSVQIMDVSSSGFVVELQGNSSPRDLETATFTFNAASGAQISGTNSFPVSVQSEFSTWYTDTNTTQSQNYGSAFSLQVPFTYSGNISDIQSVTVTLTNSQGTSTPVTGTQ